MLSAHARKEARRSMTRYIRILLLGFLLVGLGHFFLIELLGPATPIAFILIVFVVIRKTRSSDSLWELILVLFVCHHFYLGENRGGVMSYVVLLAGIVTLTRGRELGRIADGFLINMGWFLIVMNVIVGYVATGFEYADQVVYGMVILFSTLTTFKLVSTMPMTEQRLKDVLVVGGAMIVYMMLVTINQRFSFVTTNSYVAFLPPSNRDLGPTGELLPSQAEDTGTLISALTRPLGTFFHFELTGEYALLFFLLLFPFILHRNAIIGRRNAILIACSAVFLMVNTLNRGPMLLFPFAYFGGLLAMRWFHKSRISWRVLLVPLIILLPLVLFPDFVELTGVYQRLAGSDAFIGGIPSTRVTIWEEVIPKLSDISVAGLGLRPGIFMEQNMIGVAPHSLYFALPFYFGWIGGFTFILILLGRITAMFSASADESVDKILRLVATGLMLFFIAFMIDEYKIDMLRQVQYQHIVWFYIGLSFAVAKACYGSSTTGSVLMPTRSQ
jgi:hypothetical protein